MVTGGASPYTYSWIGSGIIGSETTSTNPYIIPNLESGDYVISVDSKMNQEEVAIIMQKYDLDVLPVINKRGKLLGRITIDDVVDVITETAEEERQIMSGITSDVEEDDSIWKLSNARLPWLEIGIFGGLFGAFFLGSFENN